MTTLILDTSHKYLAVGIVKNDRILAYKQEIVSKRQSELLITFIDEVLMNAGVLKSEISDVVLTNGPGSYTGMRIAMTFVKVFALTQKVNVYTLNTLLSLSGANTGFSFVDARSKRVFGAFVNAGIITDERVYSLGEVDEIDSPLFGDVHLVNKENFEPNIIQNILELKSQWKKVDDIDIMTPRYYS